MSKWFVTLALAAFLAGVAYSQGVSCPAMGVMENFEVEKYMGIWYEHLRYPFAFEVISRCISGKYALNADGTVSVSTKAWNINENVWNEIDATATKVAPGKYSMKFASGPIKQPIDYWILGTDYTNYAVVYSCSETAKFIKGQKVWIMTRDMNPSQDVVDNALAVMDKYGLDKDILQKSYQTKCPKRTLF